MKHWLIIATVSAILTFGLGVQAASAQGGGGYVVQPGDTLHVIATRFGVSPGELAAANRLDRNAWVYTGQQLTIPVQSPDPPGGHATRRHAGQSAISCPSANGKAFVSDTYAGCQPSLGTMLMTLL